MRRRHFVIAQFAATLVAARAVPALAQMGESESMKSGKPLPTEQRFVNDASRFVTSHYPSTAAAKKAGFIQFTAEDKTGALSWADQKWNSTDAQHPSEVWYDVEGRVIGADYTLLQADSATAPERWGVDPRRWIKIRAHMHYGLRMPDGMVSYRGMSVAKFAAAGGSTQAPTKQMLVNAGVAKSSDDVAFVFYFPAIWDLQLWVIPNPDGAFAEANPNVKPHNAEPHSM
ncbi:MAG: hypothetical protein JO101_08250 [Candidatus Eremiobacteraeota bacterium]|nr:hypothetical protein [Candidatus Eremiobacteraeota bacterium]MBV8355295.1 hypothetical protein [Candidatus Eremiobacteraeota bacterium]